MGYFLHLEIRKNMMSFLKSLSVSLFILLAASAANAVTISPTSVEISPTKKVVTLTFVNDTARDINVQSSILSWTQTNGKDAYVPSKDIVVVPAIATVKAGKTQTFRVSKVTFDTAEVEKSYRLYLEDVSPDFVDPKQQDIGVTFKFNQNLPVYYSTSKAKANRVFKAASCAADNAQQACIRIDNNDSRRLTVTNVVFQSATGKPQDDIDAGVVGTVLATGFKEFRFNKPANASSSVVVKTTFGDTTISIK